MIEVPNQNDWNPVLVGLGFVTVNNSCFFAFTNTPTDFDIHFTTNAQIWGYEAKTLYIKNEHPATQTLTYAVGII